MPPPELRICDLGAGVPYGEALAAQNGLHEERVAGKTCDALLLLEHAPVYTLGRNAEVSHVLFGAAELAARGIEVYPASRGGDVTYHGPGQLVGYPVIHIGEAGRRLRVVEYVGLLEDVLIRVLAEFGIAGGRDARNRGVWVGNDKVAAIGIRVAHFVTMHGFALNVNTNLSDYAGIVACGLKDAGVTSMARLLGAEVDMGAVKRAAGVAFREVFGY